MEVVDLAASTTVKISVLLIREGSDVIDGFDLTFISLDKAFDYFKGMKVKLKEESEKVELAEDKRIPN